MKHINKAAAPEKTEHPHSASGERVASSFRVLCETIQKIRETRSIHTKIFLCAEYFNRLIHDQDLNLAARFIGEGAFESVSGKRVSVGSRTSATAAAEFCEIDYERVFKPSRTATGSSSETIEKLMKNVDTARKKRKPERLALSEVDQIFHELAGVKGRVEKQEILIRSWKQMTPVEIKYFIRMLGQGSLQIGFETRSVITAIAEAFNKNPTDVRYVHMITGSIGKTAVLAKNARLHKAQFRLFHPLSFMLASPIEIQNTDDLHGYIAEEKFDGMRCQAHIDGKRVKLYSRDLNDVTKSFPDLSAFFTRRDLPPTVLDGEICVYKNETIRPFQHLQKRMGLKKPGEKILNDYPVIYIAYDLLYIEGSPVFDKTLAERRKLLETLAKDYHLPLSTQTEVHGRKNVELLFNRALAHGNEGLVLKKKDSSYEYGQRRKSWLKVKKPGGTLDTVIMYAHAGSGRRGSAWSEFTLGISVKEDERYEEEFVPIGKAFSNYTGDELKEINKKIVELTVERYGPTRGLIPELMVEIEFDDIRINKRTKAGYTLRLPRFRAIRWDLSPQDANTLKDVERLYREKLERKRLKQGQNPSFFFIDPTYIDI